MTWPAVTGSIWYIMLKPISVAIDVPVPRERVYDVIDAMAEHAAFTDHYLSGWSYSGPERGVGAKGRATVKSGWVTDEVEIEVVESAPPRLQRERIVSARGRRVGYGTYELDELPGGGTRVRSPTRGSGRRSSNGLLVPIVRGVLRKENQDALDRLAEVLAGRSA